MRHSWVIIGVLFCNFTFAQEDFDEASGTSSIDYLLEQIELGNAMSPAVIGGIDYASSVDEGSKETSITGVLLRDNVCNTAKSLIGTPYRYGGTTTNGFDCSGFVRFVYQEYAISLPHSSSAMSAVGKEVSREEIAVGDLLFFKGGNKQSKSVGHVGIVVSASADEVLMIHSATHGGVRVDNPFTQAYYVQRYVKAMRVVE